MVSSSLHQHAAGFPHHPATSFPHQPVASFPHQSSNFREYLQCVVKSIGLQASRFKAKASAQFSAVVDTSHVTALQGGKHFCICIFVFVFVFVFVYLFVFVFGSVRDRFDDEIGKTRKMEKFKTEKVG